MAANQNTSVDTARDEEADTIELVLSPEERLRLERAAEAHAAQAPPPAQGRERVSSRRDLVVVPRPPVPKARGWSWPTTLWRRIRARPRGTSTAIDLGIVVLLIGLAYLAQAWLAGPATTAATTRRPSVPTPSSAAGAESPTPAPTAADPQPVQFKNPFDSSEIFEFPAGTSQAQAREAVAEVLMRRARERVSSLEPPRRGRIRGPAAPSMTAQNSETSSP